MESIFKIESAVWRSTKDVEFTIKANQKGIIQSSVLLDIDGRNASDQTDT